MRLVLHELERVRKLIQTVEDMRDHRLYVEPPACHKRRKLFHPQPSARHEATVDLLVPHPDAPFRTRQANVFSAAEIIDISDFSAWLQDFYDRNERIDIAACDDCTVNTSSTSQFQNLPIDGAIFIADEIGSTVLSRCIYADGPRSDCEDSGCAAERCPATDISPTGPMPTTSTVSPNCTSASSAP